MFFAEELAKLANLGILDHGGSLLGLGGNHIVNTQARGEGNSNCRWAGILIVADHVANDHQSVGLGESRWFALVGEFSDDSLWHRAVTPSVLAEDHRQKRLDVDDLDAGMVGSRSATILQISFHVMTRCPPLLVLSA
jgi:hypothetical protein